MFQNNPKEKIPQEGEVVEVEVELKGAKQDVEESLVLENLEMVANIITIYLRSRTPDPWVVRDLSIHTIIPN